MTVRGWGYLAATCIAARRDRFSYINLNNISVPRRNQLYDWMVFNKIRFVFWVMQRRTSQYGRKIRYLLVVCGTEHYGHFCLTGNIFAVGNHKLDLKMHFEMNCSNSGWIQNALWQTNCFSFEVLYGNLPQSLLYTIIYFYITTPIFFSNLCRV